MDNEDLGETFGHKHLLSALELKLTRAYRRLRVGSAPNLLGDRDIEYSWIVAKLPAGPGTALDVGCGSSWVGLAAARRGFIVTGVDLAEPEWHYTHSSLTFVQTDVLDLDPMKVCFDLIICCSTIEHVGIAGRYNVSRPKPDGDLEAMVHLKRLIRSNGLMLLTIPLGRDAVVEPLHRVYGSERLRKLFAGWCVREEEYWIKDDSNRWKFAASGQALSVRPSGRYYALGLFVLTPER